MLKYNIATEFTDTPGARLRSQGPFSGEQFREECLLPLYKKAKQTKDTIEITLDGSYGYPASFLEESFGGLAREFPSDDILSAFIFISNDQPELIKDIRSYVEKNRNARR